MLTLPPETRFLVTGAAGFIGYHLSARLLAQGHEVIAIDNFSPYYDVRLKQARFQWLCTFKGFSFIEGDISRPELVSRVFQEKQPQIVVNLAAQAGVRYSLQDPQSYIQSNIVGFANILEACRHTQVEHLLYASSSSVYGGNTKVPFDECDPVDHPVSLYAASKRSNELMADCYAHLYGIPTTGLRFFTVYGPYGRPDMAYFGFTNRYFQQAPINVYNNGDAANDLSRDFTYIDDAIESVTRLIPLAPNDPGRLHTIYNVGGNHPESLTHFIAVLEKALGRASGPPVRFEKIFEPLKPGDVHATYASTDKLYRATGFRPQTPLEEGLESFANWYVEYHKIATIEPRN